MCWLPTASAHAFKAVVARLVHFHCMNMNNEYDKPLLCCRMIQEPTTPDAAANPNQRPLLMICNYRRPYQACIPTCRARRYAGQSQPSIRFTRFPLGSLVMTDLIYASADRPNHHRRLHRLYVLILATVMTGLGHLDGKLLTASANFLVPLAESRGESIRQAASSRGSRSVATASRAAWRGPGNDRCAPIAFLLAAHSLQLPTANSSAGSDWCQHVFFAPDTR